MKKVVSMVLVAAVLCLGLVFVSCGSNCPGGSKYGQWNADEKAGECYINFSKVVYAYGEVVGFGSDTRVCDNESCAVTGAPMKASGTISCDC